MVHVLLVANKTLGSEEVSEFVRTRMEKDECQFTLLVPATPRSGSEPASRLTKGLASASEGASATYDTEDNYEYARTRLQFGLETLRKLGATVDGDVGDPNPAKAIPEVLQRRHFDEVALSTLPRGISRWLPLNVPRQIERKFKIPVSVIKVQSV